MRIGYVNLIDAAALTASSSATSFPVTNLQDSRMTRKWKGAASGATTINVGTSALTATMACVNAHDAVSGDTIELLGYSDSGRTSLSTTITFDINAYGTAEIFTSASLYWRFRFNTASAISVGGLFLGTHLIAPAYEIGHSVTEISASEFSLSKTRQLYGLNPLFYREASYLLPSVTWDEKDDLTELFLAVGNSTPFYLLQYPDRQDLRRVFYCRLRNTELKWQEHEKNIQLYKDLRLNIQEVF